jgi:hypothetical protein
VIILTLFGTTTGLELVQIPLAEIPASLKFENSWIEITERQIVTTADNDAFIVFRKVVGSNIVTWVGLYRPALEFGGSRSGSFYGAGAWLVDCVVDVRTLTEILKDLADQIQATAMNGNRFVKRIADARHEIKVPSLASSLASNLSKITGGCHPSGDTALIINSGNAAEIIDWAQRARSAYSFSKLFIAAADQVPGQSGQAAIVVHRSLPLAIEAAYLRLGNDLHTTRNELGATKQKLDQDKKIESDLRSEIVYLKSLLEGARAEAKRANEISENFRLNQAEAARQKAQQSVDQHRIFGLENELKSNVPIISMDSSPAINTSYQDEVIFDQKKILKSSVQISQQERPKNSVFKSADVDPEKPSRDGIDIFFWVLVSGIFLLLFIVIYLAIHRYDTPNTPALVDQEVPSKNTTDPVSEYLDVVPSYKIGSQEFQSSKLISSVPEKKQSNNEKPRSRER